MGVLGRHKRRCHASGNIIGWVGMGGGRWPVFSTMVPKSAADASDARKLCRRWSRNGAGAWAKGGGKAGRAPWGWRSRRKGWARVGGDRVGADNPCGRVEFRGPTLTATGPKQRHSARSRKTTPAAHIHRDSLRPKWVAPGPRPPRSSTTSVQESAFHASSHRAVRRIAAFPNSTAPKARPRGGDGAPHFPSPPHL